LINHQQVAIMILTSMSCALSDRLRASLHELQTLQ
jgi:hypothetical protein